MWTALRSRGAIWVAAALTVLPTAVVAAPARRATVAEAASPKLLRQCPGGRLYAVGDQRLLLLAGSPYQMGHAHGTLLRDEVREACKLILTFARAADNVRSGDFLADTLAKAYRRLEPFIPPRYQREMQGLADASGVAIADVRLANVFPAQFHCSGFALFGRATTGGQLLHGRVLDYITEIGLQKYAVTVLARPTGRHAFANVTYSGFIGSVSGMNARQIAIGEMGGRGEGLWDGVPMALLLRKALEEADTLDEAVDIFRRARRTCEYYYVVSDGKVPDARGLYCTPKEFVSLRPGQKHARLPDAVDDAVIFSASDRLRQLLSRVRAGYGRIDARAALDLMLRPVAMKSNLHDVLFAPRELQMWVAHASADLTRPDYQACFQPYRRYDVRRLLALLPPAPKADRPPATAPAPATRPAATQPAERIGRVPVTVFRPVAPPADAATAKLLKGFQVAPAGFDWHMKRTGTIGPIEVHDLSFPSPLTTPVECNNTVYGQYFIAPGKRPRAAAIVLHILGDPKFTVARIVSYRLACAGVHALLVKLPYYGQRRPKDTARFYEMTSDPNALVDGVRQGVMDVRRAARWLSAQPEVDANRVGICGVSLGGFVAASVAGIDGHFPRVAIVLAGGDLGKVLAGQAREVRGFRKAIAEAGLSDARLRDLLRPIDPLTHAGRLKASDVIMINASQDEIVPAECARRLAEACGARISWYPAGHYSMVMYLPAALEKVARHFSAKDWTTR